MEKALHVGVATVGLDGQQTFVSQRMAEMVGYSVEEISGISPPFPYWPEEHRESIEDAFRRMLAGEQPPEGFHLVFCRKGGERFDVNIMVAPLIVSGAPQGYLACVTDVSEHRRAVRELEQSEERYRKLVELAPTGIGILLDGVVHFANRAAAEILRAETAEQLLGRRVLELVHPSERASAADALQAVLDGSEMLVRQYTLVRLDGTPARIEIVGARTMFQGQPAVQTAFYDLDSRHELASLRAAVERSGEIVFVADREGTMSYVNPEFTRVYGWAPEEVVGKTTPRILKSGFVTQEVYEQFWRLLLDKQVVQGEIKNRTKDGRILDIEGSANAILDDSGEITGFLAVQRDITERKRQEERFRLAQFAIDHASEAVFRFDPSGFVRDANDFAASLLGCLPAELSGKHLCALDVGVAHASWDEHWKKLERSRSLMHEGELVTRSGGRIPVEVACSIAEYAGELHGFAFMRDVRERNELAAQLQHSQKMEAVGRLAGGVAHDFNNLLSVILTFSSFIRDELQESDPMRQDVLEIEQAAQRAAALARQLLIFSRRDMTRPRPMDLNSVISELHRLLERTLGEDVHLVMLLEPEVWPVMLDPTQLEQVLVNLAVNARDAMPRGGTLTIETRNIVPDADARRRHLGLAEGRYVRVAVSDTGAGMEPEVLARAFEPFFTTKTVGKGTGLGLSIVYGIVKQAGGDIAMQSAPGMGTTFELLFPATERSADTEAPRSIPAEDPATGTVLVVEDEESVRSAMVRILRRAGFQVIDAANAGEALMLFERAPGSVDLLLTDVVMPHVSGPELAARLRRIEPRLRVLYASGHPDKALSDQHQLPPGTPFLKKPFAREELLAAVRDALRKAP